MSRSSSGAPHDVRSDVRSSALWGTGHRGGDSRSSALWGRGGRGVGAALVAVLTLALPLAATADDGKDKKITAFVPSALLQAARQNEHGLFRVIVEAAGKSSNDVEHDIKVEQTKNPGESKGVDDKFEFIGSVSAQLTGEQILDLAKKEQIRSITPDAPVRLTDYAYSSTQLWPYVSGNAKLWGSTSNPAPAASAPAIAIVDSGIDSGRADFGGRVVAEVNLTSLAPNSPGDGRGHGTFVAGIAAGQVADYAGAAPYARLVSIDVMDDNGMARTSDVIAAAEWILANKATYNIRVANFSLHSVMPSNFTRDPLDKAVEKLWFGGVVVVVAVGNYGVVGGPSGVKYAPGNDPFVITVGAVDLNGQKDRDAHTIAPWSAYGRTFDGFAKPDVVTDGRYMIGPIPTGSTLAAAKAANIVAPGYIRLSGTSFAAPIVSGAAAQILARHPDWSPNQVKGALMLTAKPDPLTPPLSTGVGEANAGKAAQVVSPPNPNLALDQFVKPDPVSGTPVFDAVSWDSAARANVSWDSVSWTDASWSSASWSSVSWMDVSWDSVSWTDASWADAATGAVSWTDVSWEDAAALDSGSISYALTPAQQAAIAADPDFAPLP